MAAATSSPFHIHSVHFSPSTHSSRSIFGDVSAAKKRVLEIRRSARAKAELGLANSLGEGGSTDSLRVPETLSTRFGMLLELETRLSESESLCSVLQRRKKELSDLMQSLNIQIRSLKESAATSAVSEPSEDACMSDESPAEPSSGARTKKRQRYFEDSSSQSKQVRSHKLPQPISIGESDEDLSTVVCPFDLMVYASSPTITILATIGYAINM